MNHAPASRVAGGTGGVGLVAVQVAAFWPVWPWLAARLADGGEDGAGLLAAATALAVAIRGRSRPDRGGAAAVFVWPVALTLAYAAAYPWLLPLPRAALALTALGSALSALRFGRPLHPGMAGLMLLSLPAIPSLQFYAGHPLRLLVARAAAPLLQVAGFAVVPEGTGLRWGEQVIWVDAPCSGVRMLWAGVFAACAAACFFEAGARRTALAAGAGAAAAVAANVLRTTALFFTEAGLVAAPGGTHEAVGLAAFAMAAAVPVAVARGRRPPGITPPAGLRRTGDAVVPTVSSPAPGIRRAELLACAVAALVPFVPAESRSGGGNASFPGWPATFEGRPLRALPLTPREERFAAGFPGRLGRFTDGPREIVIRWTAEGTRRLHPAADCFRGTGHDVRPLPAYLDAEGRTWGCFEASKDGTTIRVRERITDDAGRGWADVSSWYWATLWGESDGPWWAMTVAEGAEALTR